MCRDHACVVAKSEMLDLSADIIFHLCNS